MHFYIYKLAGLEILCRVPFQVKIKEESKEFFFPVLEKNLEKECFDYVFTMKAVDFLPAFDRKKAVAEKKRLYIKKEELLQIFYAPIPGGDSFACVEWQKGSREISCSYLKEKKNCVEYSSNLFSLLSPEFLLFISRGFLIHASFIRMADGGGVLFSAPPQTGKSTQAELWKTLRGAEVINGDRAAVIYDAGKIYAYGLPYAGSSGIYRNEFAELRAIVALRKGQENKIYRIKGPEVIRYLFPEAMVHRWDPQFSMGIIDRLLNLCDVLPVYYLECLPNEGAVEALEQAIRDNNN